MPKKIMINKELTPGRPRSALNKAELPEPKVGELPKKIIGSHMGAILNPTVPQKPAGPVLGRPAKLPPRPRKGPPTI